MLGRRATVAAYVTPAILIKNILLGKIPAVTRQVDVLYNRTWITGGGSLRCVQWPDEPPESLAVAPWLNLLEPDDFCVLPPDDNTLLASPPPEPNERLMCLELK